jgi:hypothetical protein
MVWHLMSVLEAGLRLGSGADLAGRGLRQAAEQQPVLEATVKSLA